MLSQTLEINANGLAHVLNFFANPMNIVFGEGKMLITPFECGDYRGVMLSEASEPLRIGDVIVSQLPDTPQPGQVYLSFGNVESVRVLHEILGQIINDFKETVK